MSDTFVFNQAEILGISLSDKNFAKTLWEKYCSSVTSLSAPSTSASEGSLQEDAGNTSEWDDHLSVNEKTLSILNAIQDGQEGSSAGPCLEQLHWIEDQIMILYRLKGDIELNLRKPSTSEPANLLL